jgi:hypothetical protein
MIDRPWFAFWPVTVKGETRWLEWVAVEYRIVIAGYSDVRPGKIHKHAVHFIAITAALSRPQRKDFQS